MSHAVCLVTFLIRFSLELNLFERRAIKTDYFTFNSTGNARRMTNLSPRDSGGGVMENKVWYKTKPEMVVYNMSDIDITWPENLLWIYIFFKKKYVLKTSGTTIMSRGDKIHIIHHWGPNYGVHIILTLFKIVSWCLGMKIASISQQIITWNLSKHVLSICVPRR